MKHTTVGYGTKFAGPYKCIGTAQSPITFGKYCSIAPGVKIMTTNHDWNYPCMQGTFYRDMFNTSHPGEIGVQTAERSKGGVTIGNDVWLGEDVFILGGVIIGDGAIVGARAVITKDVEPYSIVAGVPGKKVGMRYDSDIIDFFLNIQWWDWPVDRIKRNGPFFMMDINKSNLQEISNTIIS